MQTNVTYNSCHCAISPLLRFLMTATCYHGLAALALLPLLLTYPD